MSGEGEALPGDDKIIVDCDFDEPPDKLWRALTEPRLVAAWLMEGDIAECEVLAVEPGRLISYSWRERAGGETRETVVTFAVSETASGGAHLRLVHDAAPGRPVMGFARRRIVPRATRRPLGAHGVTRMQWAA
jgi:uncharacterized protein YndB with AHSA1/START domain